MRIKKFNEICLQLDMTDYFINNLHSPITEKSIIPLESSIVKDVIKKTIKDLKLNLSIIASYGTGITMMYPIVYHCYRIYHNINDKDPLMNLYRLLMVNDLLHES